MDANQQPPNQPNPSAPIIPHKEPAQAPASTENAIEREKNPVKRLLKILGPGLISGASDDDPSGIGTAAVAGASLGFKTLWVQLFSIPLLATVQYMCAKIGMVTGMGISGVLRRHYSRKIMYPMVGGLVIANTINAGVDIGAIAAAFKLLVPGISIPLVTIAVGVVIIALQVWGSYRLIANVFKWLTLVLLAYIATAFFARPDLGEVLKNTFIPQISFDKTTIATLVALLGTGISPYLFFWQASQEVEEEISMGRTKLKQRKGASDKELKYAWLDVNIGMVLSNLVMYFIVLTTAATLFTAGKHDVQSAADAAEALRPLAGNAASLLLAVGLIGAGFLAVPILTGSAAYGVSEALGWQFGFDKKPGRAKQFYAIIAVATVVGMAINFLGINPIQALFWASVINGFVAPPLLVILMLIGNNKKVMGERTNGRWINIFGGLTTIVMTVAAIAFLITLVQPG